MDADGVLPVERRFHEILAMFPREVRAGLLDVLSLRDSAERAQWIARVYQAGRCHGAPSS